jgi:hypothetical protein
VEWTAFCPALHGERRRGRRKKEERNDGGHRNDRDVCLRGVVERHLTKSSVNVSLGLMWPIRSRALADSASVPTRSILNPQTYNTSSTYSAPDARP